LALIGYARVSTAEQSLALQRDALAHLAAGLTVREAAARVKVGKTALYAALAGSTVEPAA
jgi:DNA invertase Pin-like site-specific DNA recombinase